MQTIIECVPNFSEGRNQQTIQAIANAIKSQMHTRLLHIDSGASANRTVYTFAGAPDSVLESAFQAIQEASKHIDMRTQSGVHARLGAADVCPIVPVKNCSMKQCIEWAHILGKRVGEELGIPVYLYEEAASVPERRNLAYIRKGEYESLKERLKEPRWKPDYGPDQFNAKSGATVIGAREFLVAYNINLATQDVTIAKNIARVLRHSGYVVPTDSQETSPDQKHTPVRIHGKFRYVKAIGWFIEEFNLAQVSMNLTNYKENPIHEVYEACKTEASNYHVDVLGSELIGLVPENALLTAGYFYYQQTPHAASELPSHPLLIQYAIQHLGLDSLHTFNPEERILEYRLQQAFREK